MTAHGWTEQVWHITRHAWRERQAASPVLKNY